MYFTASWHVLRVTSNKWLGLSTVHSLYYTLQYFNIETFKTFEFIRLSSISFLLTNVRLKSNRVLHIISATEYDLFFFLPIPI